MSFNPSSLVGMAESEAVSKVGKAGMSVKLQDSRVPSCLTADFCPNRIILIVANGLVVNAHLG